MQAGLSGPAGSGIDNACGLHFRGPFAYLTDMSAPVPPFPGVDRRITARNVMTARADFLAANRGLRVPMPGFVLLASPNEGHGVRYGITVTKKIGNAVVRNRMKRRFRELLWQHLPALGLPDHDHVLIGREGGVERDFAKLSEELATALGRAARGEGQRGRPPRRKRSR